MSKKMNFRQLINKCVTMLLVATFSVVLPSQATEKPNVLFIFADDLGWGDLGIHGSKTIETPNLDELASQGSEFYQFTVANPVCSPSRAGLITGHNPARHSVHHHFAHTEHQQKYAMPDWLEPSVLTIPKVMKQAGYTTAHFGKWHLTNSHIPDAPLLENYGYDESAVFNGPGKQTDGWKVYDDTIEFIENNKDKPFFINLWIHEPHTPHYPDPKMMKKYSHLNEQQQVYAAVVEGADQRIGRVLQALKDNNLDENTLIVFSSDNGAEESKPETHRYLRTDPDAKIEGIEPLGRYFSVGDNAGLRGAKRYTYEGGVRVPLIVKWPGKVPAGVQNTTSLINAVDFLPTFADLVNIKLPRDYQSDGESVLPQLKGELVERQKPIFWEWHYKPIETDSDYDNSMLVVRKGDWKLFLDRTHNKTELYNIAFDRSESRNLVQQYPSVVSELTRLVMKWKGTLPRKPDPRAFSSLRQE
jgi:arylsulfatase A-like enzyme